MLLGAVYWGGDVNAGQRHNTRRIDRIENVQSEMLEKVSEMHGIIKAQEMHGRTNQH